MRGNRSNRVVAAWSRQLVRFVSDESGPTTTEYAVMFALILVVCLASIGSLGLKVSTKFADASLGW